MKGSDSVSTFPAATCGANISLYPRQDPARAYNHFRHPFFSHQIDSQYLTLEEYALTMLDYQACGSPGRTKSRFTLPAWIIHRSSVALAGLARFTDLLRSVLSGARVGIASFWNARRETMERV